MLCFIFLFFGLFAESNSEIKKVFVMHIDSEIDPRMNRYTKLGLAEATKNDVDLIIIEMDTYGGAVNDADDIRARILEYEKPIYVFINKNAASAGALISIACDSIYMAAGASIGAATVVNAEGKAAPDKYQSYMRSMMRSTAEANGRDPKIAEAMVDQDLGIDSLSPIGQVITFSTSEAIKNGFCEAQVKNIDDLLERNGITGYEKIAFKLDPMEKVIAFFINPFISGILILVIIGGIYFELQTPGVGFPIIASIVALVLYLTPYYLNGLAENWEILLLFLGIGLIILEIFVVPGFGLVGISGIILSTGSLVLVMINNISLDFTFVSIDKLLYATISTLIGLFGSIIVMVFGGARLASSHVFKKITLQEVQHSKEGYSSHFRKNLLIGKIGMAYTVLRPSGKVMIDSHVFDAYTRGEYIDSGSTIEVLEDSGISLKVRKATDT